MFNSLKEFKSHNVEDRIISTTTTTEESPMQKFYKDKGIFLTGGTGFFGKIITEKLLRDTEIAQIYLLIRPKKGKDAVTRLNELFDDPVFDGLKKRHPNYREKIVIISGDCSLPALGISQSEREIIKENVNIVIHGAATVRFDEKLKMAIAINVSGTKEMLKLAKEIVHLKAFVHVSTAFAHCNNSHIQEKFYKSNMSGENACKLSECLDEPTLNTLTPTIIKGYPNTYTYTKVLAEDVVLNQADNLPVTVFRPGIVVTSYKEPISGWTDNMYGPAGMIVGIGSGVLRVFIGKAANSANIVPVDLCVNSLLASAWDVARNTYDVPPVYNYVPDPQNMITWQEYIEEGFKLGVEYPLAKCIWYPRLSLVEQRFTYNILWFLYHTIPALFMDMLMVLMGKKPRMLKIYRKISKFCDVMEYFSSNSFYFDTDNVQKLRDNMHPLDKEIFNCDMRTIEWIELFKSSLVGLRTFIVKDDMSTIPQSLKRHKRLKVLHYTTLYIIYAVVFLVLYKMFKWLLF